MNNRLLSSLRLFILCFLGIGGHLTAFTQAETPTLPMQVEGLPVIDSLSDHAVAFYTAKLWSASQLFDSIITIRYAQVRSTRNDIELELKSAQKDSTVSKPQLAEIKQRLKNAKTIEKVQEQHQKQSKQALALAQKTNVLDSIGQRKSLTILWKKVLTIQSILIPEPAPSALTETKPDPKPENISISATPAVADSTTTNPKEVAKEKDKKPIKPGPIFKKYDPATDVMLNPPPLPCLIVSDTRDEFSGQRIRETAAQELFRYSNPALKRYLQGKTHVIGQTSLLATGSNVVLRLHFTVNDPNARKAFGKMDKNAVAVLEFIDGSSFTLYNTQTDEGSFDPSGQVATYRAQYSLDELILKKLRRTELDKVRIAWANGYDDYEVQQLDVLMSQLKCL